MQFGFYYRSLGPDSSSIVGTLSTNERLPKPVLNCTCKKDTMKESHRQSSVLGSLSTRNGSVLDLVQQKSKPLRVVYEYEMGKFTNLTTFHGLIRWYNGNWKAKLFWTIIIGVAITCFVVQCVNSWMYYIKKPTVTTVEFVAQTNGSDFPSVTICNYNPVRKSVVESYNMSSDVFDYIIMAYLQVEDLYATHNVTEIREYHKEYEIYLQQNPGFSVNKFLMEGGYQCEQMFLECTFAGLPMNCCNFAVPVLTDMGRCYQFPQYSHASWLNRQYISGPYYGFQAFLNVSVDEYTDTVKSNFYETGVRMVVHPHGSTASVGSGGLSCSPGNKLYAGITQTQYILLPPEQWGQCKSKFVKGDFNINYTNNIIDLNNTEKYKNPYSTNNCEIVCLAQHFYQKCGCIPLRYFNSFAYGVAVCDPLEMLNCSRVLNKSGDTNYWYKICPMCGIECERWTYNVESSYIQIPTSPGKKLKKRLNMSDKQIRENLVILNVYLSDINFVKYQQVQATSLTATLSAMGGNMGLFLGCSMVTCFEIIVFLVKCCYGSCLPKRRAKVQIKRFLETQASSSSYNITDLPIRDNDPNKATTFYITDNIHEKYSQDEILSDRDTIIENMNDNIESSDGDESRRGVLHSVYKKFAQYFGKPMHKKGRSNSSEPIIINGDLIKNIEEPVSIIHVPL